MLNKSLFVSDEVHEREIELADGSKHTMYFKELPAATFQKYAFSMASKNDDEKVKALSELIVAGVVNEDGKPALTVKDAGRLKVRVADALYNAIQEVNSGRPKEPTSGDSGTS